MIVLGFVPTMKIRRWLCQEDILLRDMLEEHQKKHPTRLQVFFTLDRPPRGWTKFSGSVICTYVRRGRLSVEVTDMWKRNKDETLC